MTCGLMALLLAIGLFRCPSVAAIEDDGPGRFDLSLDLRGDWKFESMTGCEEYMAITGTTHFESGPMTCIAFPKAGMRQIVWQDCLEMTISGDSDTGGGQSPLHHMILNDAYITDDWSQAGTPARWTSKIVAAGSLDLDADSPVVVFNGELGQGFEARRYRDTKGRMIMSWTAVNETSRKPVSFQIKMTKEMDLPCKGYDPTECAGRMYTDGVGSAGWTPACCLESYGNHQPNPNQRACEGQTLSTPAPTAASSLVEETSSDALGLCRMSKLVAAVCVAIVARLAATQ